MSPKSTRSLLVAKLHSLPKAGLILLALLLTIPLTARALSMDGPAELPRSYVQSSLADTPAPGATIVVGAQDDLQDALNSANCGDTIALQPQARFIGKFTLPKKNCDDQHWIVIRTNAADYRLPKEGSRVTPCYAGVTSLPGRPSFACVSSERVLPQIAFDGRGTHPGPIVLDEGANHYRLLGLEITRLEGTGGTSALVSSGDDGRADHIIIDRAWIHGTTHDETRAGVLLRGVTNAAVVDSFFSDFHCTSRVGTCTDSKAIGGGNGNNSMGPFKIVNNFLEAAGECILFGGGGATKTPADIEIRKNHFFKPLLWMPKAPGFIGGVSGDPFVVKNHFELKNAQRVLLEGNIFENNWGGFTQNGKSIVLTPRNNFSPVLKAHTCPLCKVTDVTIRYNTISHVGGGIGIANGLTEGKPAQDGERFSIHDIIIDDVDAKRFAGNGSLFLIANAWSTHVLNSISVNHVTGFPDPHGHLLTIGDSKNDQQMWGFIFTNNLVYTPVYSVWNSGMSNSCAASNIPVVVITNCFRGYIFDNNVLFSDHFVRPPSDWPKGNFFTNAPGVDFVNYRNGDGGNYNLSPSSRYKRRGTDGQDPGANVAAVHAAIAGAY